MKKEGTTDLKDLRWLVEQRSRVQDLLLHIYSSIPEQPVSPNDPVPGIRLILAGAAFSLWRAVFLIDVDRTQNAMYDHAREFFLALIRDNAINYSQDRSARAWSAGYYLNNAFFRLQFAYDIVERYDMRLDLKNRASVRAWLDDQAAFHTVRDLRTQWTKAYEATEAFFVSLQ